MDKMFCPIQKDGACIYVKLLEAKISRRSRAKLQNYHRGLQKGRNLVVNDNLNKQGKTMEHFKPEDKKDVLHSYNLY